jgi:hypothetical protein
MKSAIAHMIQRADLFHQFPSFRDVDFAIRQAKGRPPVLVATRGDRVVCLFPKPDGTLPHVDVWLDFLLDTFIRPHKP